MPTFTNTRSPAAPGKHPRPYAPFRSQRAAHNFVLAGVTRDASGNPLGSCIVQLFRTGDDSFVQEITSDGSGNYQFTLPDNAGNFYCVAYKSGVPDVAGTTANTLVAV